MLAIIAAYCVMSVCLYFSVVITDIVFNNHPQYLSTPTKRLLALLGIFISPIIVPVVAINNIYHFIVEG